MEGVRGGSARRLFGTNTMTSQMAAPCGVTYPLATPRLRRHGSCGVGLCLTRRARVRAVHARPWRSWVGCGVRGPQRKLDKWIKHAQMCLKARWGILLVVQCNSKSHLSVFVFQVCSLAGLDTRRNPCPRFYRNSSSCIDTLLGQMTPMGTSSSGL